MNKNKKTPDKTCLITGVTSGIGEATAREIKNPSYQLAIFAKDSEKTRIALERLRGSAPSSNIKWIPVDLASVASVKKACTQAIQDLDSMDLLITNAGVYKRKMDFTPDNLEMTIAVNYGALFMISRLLVDLLKNASNPVILNLTSALYSKGSLPETFPFEYKRVDRFQDLI